LVLGWQVLRYGAMPELGGLNAQAAGLIPRMSTALNVYDAVRSQAQAKDNVAWAKANPGLREIYGNVMKLRAEVAENG